MQLRWDKAHVHLSKCLADLLIEHWQTQVEASHTQLQQVLAEGSRSASPESMQHLQNILKKAEEDIQRDMIARARQRPARNTDEAASAGTQPSHT